jgi:hypothetical protein
MSSTNRGNNDYDSLTDDEEAAAFPGATEVCDGDDDDVFVNEDMCYDPDDLAHYADADGSCDPARWVNGCGWPTIYRFYWFKFEYQGRTAEICAEDKSWEVARRHVAEMYRLREEDIETL